MKRLLLDKESIRKLTRIGDDDEEALRASPVTAPPSGPDPHSRPATAPPSGPDPHSRPAGPNGSRHSR